MARTWTDPDFISGSVALDFLNTASWTEDGMLRSERLNSFEGTIDWATAANAVSTDMAEALRVLVAQDSRSAEQALGRLREFRQDLVDVAVPIAAGSPVLPDAEESLARWLRDAQANAVLHRGDNHFHFGVPRTPGSLDAILWTVAQDALNLLTTADLQRLRRCGMDSCWWFFLDTSKNGKRRWCDMKSCGNVYKARRYYARHHTHGPAA